MSEEVKGVFVRLPLSDAAQELLVDAAAFGKPDDSHDKAILAIGTPVTGGDVPVAAYTSQHDIDRVRKGKSGDIYGAKNWEGSDEEVFNIPLVRQSDAQAKIAALEVEVVRLMEIVTTARTSISQGKPMKAAYALEVALKGGAA